METKLLVSEPDGAAMMSISAKTLSRMRKAGEMPAVKIGTSIRYSVRTIEAWIAANERQECEAANG